MVGETASQCRQIVRAGHQCPRAAKTDGFCDAHWRMRFGHSWNFKTGDFETLTCDWCRVKWRETDSANCLLSPYLDQPPTVYPEPTQNHG